MADITLKEGSNMRDVFDICQKHGLPSLAQGMIEFPPPMKLRKIASEHVLRDDCHTYRTRMGESDFKESIAQLVDTVYGEKIRPENVLAVAGVAGGVSAALLHLRRKKKTGCKRCDHGAVLHISLFGGRTSFLPHADCNFCVWRKANCST